MKACLRRSWPTSTDGSSPIRILIASRSGSSLAVYIRIALKETPCSICWDVCRRNSIICHTQFRKTVLAKAGTEVSAVLRTGDSRRLPYSPDGSRACYERLQGLNLGRLLESQLVSGDFHADGSQDALKAWLSSRLSFKYRTSP